MMSAACVPDRAALRASLGLEADELAVLVPEPSVRSCGQFEAFWAVALRHFLGGRVKVIVPGDGIEVRRIERVAATLTRGSPLIRPEVGIRFRTLLPAADVYVVAPRANVMTVPIEWALSAGCLVIGTDVPVVGQVIEHDVNGLIFAPRPGKRMFTQILKHLDNTAVHDRIRATARAQALVGIDKR